MIVRYVAIILLRFGETRDDYGTSYVAVNGEVTLIQEVTFLHEFSYSTGHFLKSFECQFATVRRFCNFYIVVYEV